VVQVLSSSAHTELVTSGLEQVTDAKAALLAVRSSLHWFLGGSTEGSLCIKTDNATACHKLSGLCDAYVVSVRIFLAKAAQERSLTVPCCGDTRPSLFSEVHSQHDVEEAQLGQPLVGRLLFIHFLSDEGFQGSITTAGRVSEVSFSRYAGPLYLCASFPLNFRSPTSFSSTPCLPFS
jgi:hypothetical protein